jgi:hypothetical protein
LKEISAGHYFKKIFKLDNFMKFDIKSNSVAECLKATKSKERQKLIKQNQIKYKGRKEGSRGT